MRLPVHRWYRYSAGFSADWVAAVIAGFQSTRKNLRVLDPFAGSGTVMLASDVAGVRSVGIEAHPFVSRVANAKLQWHESPEDLSDRAMALLTSARQLKDNGLDYAPLIAKCYDTETLMRLDKLRRAWVRQSVSDGTSELLWLAITTILRVCSKAGTAQWQYVLPRKSKSRVADPYLAFQAKIQTMTCDMESLQRRRRSSLAKLITGDARSCTDVDTSSVDLVVTSPPYANNYDYADSTRLEMTFWGEIGSWGDLHDSVRKYLICSSSQHASKEKWTLENLLAHDAVVSIRSELSDVCERLACERLKHSGRKHYHTMAAAYFVDMARTFGELRRVCRANSDVCYVVGDSAPYGVHIPVEKWLGELAVSAGFDSYRFEKLRDRNIKWKNRKHRVPLQEGRLWLKG
jgi:hypothetical protein